MSRHWHTAALVVGYKADRYGLELMVNKLEISLRIARNDWGIGVIGWWPLGVGLSLGPLSFYVGHVGRHRFVGPGIAMIRTMGQWHPAAYLSDGLWWEPMIQVEYPDNQEG